MSVCWKRIEYYITPIRISASPRILGRQPTDVRFHPTLIISSNCLWCGKDINNLALRVLKDVTVQTIVSKGDIRVLLREKKLSFLKSIEDSSLAHDYHQLGSYSRTLLFWVF